MTHLGGVQKFWYDANGNMITRITTQGTYNLTYDQENRLTGVSGAATATFVYDGDGNRVKGTVNGVTTTYIGNYLEWTGSTSNINPIMGRRNHTIGDSKWIACSSDYFNCIHNII